MVAAGWLTGGSLLKSRFLHFLYIGAMAGFTAKVKQLVELLDCAGAEDRAEQLLKRNSWIVESAVNDHFQNGFESSETTPVPMEMDRTREGAAAPQSQAAGSSSGSEPSKRPRFEMPPKEMETASPAPIFGQAAHAAEISSYSAEGRALLQVFAGLSEQMEQLRIGQSAVLQQALQQELPAALIEAEVRRQAEKEQIQTAKANATRDMQLAACKSCADIGKLEGFSFLAQKNLVQCDACFRYSAFAPPALKRSNQSTGVWLGTNLRRDFRTVRQTVQRHLGLEKGSEMDGAWHEWCIAHAAEQLRVDSENRNAGLNVGKLGLMLIKQHQSDYSFERECTLLQTFDVNLGTKNHSRMFMPRLRDAFHAVTVAAMQKMLTTPLAATGYPPPFAAPADKATLLRRTGQMHGIITFVDGEIHAFFSGVLPARDGTGDGLSDLLIESLQKGKPFTLDIKQVRRQLTCLPFDGQYQSEVRFEPNCIYIYGLIAGQLRGNSGG